jgi:uridine kinase
MGSRVRTPHLIGVAGPSCAGKTELARALADRLPAPIISLDSYYVDLVHLPFEERPRTNFDVPESLDKDLFVNQLRQLSRGEEIHVPVYDFTRHIRASETKSVRAGEFVIVEGLFALYWEEVRALLGTKVFVFADDDICFGRRLERDVRERGRTPESVREQYDSTVRPMAETYILPTRRFADLVLSGTDPLEQSVRAVLTRANRW